MSHAPMLGRPAIWEPVCRKVMAGSWLIASVYIEFTMHRSSAIFAVHGSRSQIHAPAWPCRWNGKAEPASGSTAWFADIPVKRCPCRTESGKGCPCFSFKSGL